jgi:hypothetical protein
MQPKLLKGIKAQAEAAGGGKGPASTQQAITGKLLGRATQLCPQGSLSMRDPKQCDGVDASLWAK